MNKKISDIDDKSNNSNSEDSYVDDNNIENFFVIDPKTFFNQKELCHFGLLDIYYKNCDENLILIMMNIINGESKISVQGYNTTDALIEYKEEQLEDFLEAIENSDVKADDILF